MLKFLTFYLALCTTCSLVSGQRRHRRRDGNTPFVGGIVQDLGNGYPSVIVRPASWFVNSNGGRKSGKNNRNNNIELINAVPPILHPEPQLFSPDPAPTVVAVSEVIKPTPQKGTFFGFFNNARNHQTESAVDPVVVSSPVIASPIVISPDAQVIVPEDQKVSNAQRRLNRRQRKPVEASTNDASQRRRGPRRINSRAQTQQTDGVQPTEDQTSAEENENESENQPRNDRPRSNPLRRRFGDFAGRRAAGNTLTEVQDESEALKVDTGSKDTSAESDEEDVPTRCDSLLKTSAGDNDATMLALLENMDKPEILRGLLQEIAINYVEFKGGSFESE